MAPTHVQFLEVFALHEPRSSRREEAHSSNAKCVVRNAELSQSLLTSAATVEAPPDQSLDCGQIIRKIFPTSFQFVLSFNADE